MMDNSDHVPSDFAVQFLSLSTDRQAAFISFLHELTESEDNQAPAVSYLPEAH